MDEEQKLIAKQEIINRELEFEKGLMIERELRVKEIESNVLDINQIMKELAALVLEQSDSISKSSYYCAFFYFPSLLY